MNQNTTIHLEGKGYLELSESFPVPLTYNVSDIKDISTKKGAFSKTLNIPATKNNNDLLGQLFDINVTNSSFNIHRKVKCKVISNSVVVMDGYFKLEGVEKQSNTSIGGDQLMTYKATVFDQTTNFFDTLGDRLLEDLDFSQFNHIYSGSTILATSASTAADIYTYPMLYNTNTTNYGIRDFFPAIYVKAYLDKIFEQAQYSYDSEFINGISEDGLFTKLIVPFNGEHKPNNQAVIDDRKFYVGWTGATSSLTYSATSLTPDIQLLFNADSTNDWFDTPSDWNTSLSKLVSSSNQLSDYRVRIPIELKYSSPSSATLVNTFNPSLGVSTNNTPYFKPRVIVKKNGVVISSTYVSNKVSLPTTISAGTTSLTGIYVDVTIPAVNLTIGDELKFYINPTVTVPSFHTYKAGTTVVNPTYIFKILDINTTGSTLSLMNLPRQTDITDGDTIYLNEYIPKNIKQKDFIKWIVQMFNLYIEQDKDIDNKLIIKTRDEYFDNNKVVDWTHKFALDKASEIKFLPELQARDLFLTYKSGSDTWSKLYNDQYKLTYGYKKYTFDNDYLQGEQKIEIGFEATPLVENGFGLIVPSISSQAPKSGIKILYKPDTWVSGNWTFKYQVGSVQQSINLSSYPYAGHYDTPINPSVSLSFGEEDQLFYWQYGTITDNTLANRFYGNYIDQIMDGKMLTGYFDLNEVDIANLDFSSRIWIKDSAYYLNKINDYNPLSNNLTKVELIKVDAPLKFRTRNIITGGIIRPAKDIRPADIISLPLNPNILTKPIVGHVTNNVIKSKVAIVTGENNYVDQDTKAKIEGNNNIIMGETKGLIIGDGNTTNGGKSFVIGDNNTVIDGAVVFGDNIRASAPNTLYVSNLKIASGGTLDLSGVALSGTSFTASTPSLSSVLSVGNTTGSNDIILSTQKYIKNSGGTSTISTGVIGDLNRMDFVQYHNDFANTISLKDDIQFNAYDDLTGENHLQYLDANNGFIFEDSIGGILNIKRDGVKIVYTPTTVNTNTKLLTRNSSTGVVELRDVSSLSSGTYLHLTGGTISGTLTVTGNLTTQGNLLVDDFEQTSHATVQTTNATSTTIKTIPISNEYVYQIEANVVGGQNNTNQGITSKILGSFKNNGGTVTQIGKQNIIMNTDFVGTADVTMSISGTNVLVQVTGEAATTVDWGCSIIINRMSMGTI